jgi:hypothetical protein
MLLHFLTTIFFLQKKALDFNWDRYCHLALYLQLIRFNEILANSHRSVPIADEKLDRKMTPALYLMG